MSIVKAVVLKCKPGAQFHFGKIAVDDETSLDETSEMLHSDTLFSALVYLAGRAFPDYVDVLIEKFGHGNIKISSGFYLIESVETKKSIFFLPKPCTVEVGKKNKALRKIDYISKGIWESGVPPQKWTSRGDCIIFQKRFVVLREEVENYRFQNMNDWKILNTQTLPKVGVHKESKENNIYFQTNVVIPHNQEFTTNIYFLLEVDEGFYESKEWRILLNLIGLLGIEGIGGERSTGCGHIEEVVIEDFTLHLTSQFSALISLFFPSNEVELKLVSHYKTLTRSGRRVPIHGTLRRVKMIAEGAICEGTLSGHIIPVLKGADYSVLRSGKAFTIPVHQNFLL